MDFVQLPATTSVQVPLPFPDTHNRVSYAPKATMSDLIVESLVSEPFTLAGMVKVAPKTKTTIALAKLNSDNRAAVLRSLRSCIDAGHLKVVSGSEQVEGGQRQHVHHIRQDTLKPLASITERGRTAASAVQTDSGKLREVPAAPEITSDAERARLAQEEAAKLEADKKALAEKEAADKAAANKAAADEAAAAEAKRIADEAAAANTQNPPAPPASTNPAPSAPAEVPEI